MTDLKILDNAIFTQKTMINTTKLFRFFVKDEIELDVNYLENNLHLTEIKGKEISNLFDNIDIIPVEDFIIKDEGLFPIIQKRIYEALIKEN